MDDDRTNEGPRSGSIVLMALLLAGLVVALSFLLDDPSGEGPAVQPLLSAHAAVLPSPARDGLAPARTAKPDETWAADETPRGIRPDASH